jgi:DNA invertase Pin-like site-specific DNA recombinase
MRAAQYVRMSTEHQQYSIENQQTGIARYAERHGFEIVHLFRSGQFSCLVRYLLIRKSTRLVLSKLLP